MAPHPSTAETPVIDVQNEAVTESANLFLAARRLLLASLGAVALSIDEANDFVDKLVARGEVAESETQDLLKELRTRMAEKRAAVEGPNGPRAKVAKAAQALEVSVEEILERFNVPSRRDLEDIRKKIDLLNQKVDELTQK